MEPKRIWWARPRKLCLLERPGGGGRSHRPQRREAEIAYLRDSGVHLVVSCMTTRHNLRDYDAAGLDWHHVPVVSTERGVAALDELLPFLKRELNRRGAIAVHGDSHTDFVAALGAAHLHQTRGMDPAEALTRASEAGLMVTWEACALLGVDADVAQPAPKAVPRNPEGRLRRDPRAARGQTRGPEKRNPKGGGGVRDVVQEGRGDLSGRRSGGGDGGPGSGRHR